MTQHFDYANRWDEVVPHLHDPSLVAALDLRLADYCRQHLPNRTYEPGTPPWTLTRCDYWVQYAEDAFNDGGWGDVLLAEFGYDDHDVFTDAMDADPSLEERWFERSSELEEQFYPKPGTIQFYQCFGACHWMVDYFLGLAQRVEPSLEWKIVRGVHHSTVAGRRPGEHRFCMVFDPLRPNQPPRQTLADARRK